MHTSLNTLNQKAIKAALNANWEEAIKINHEILTITPEDTATKLRLGKAYLQSSDFTKAKKLFKEILDKDPINKIAQKNYELAKNNKKEDDKAGTGKKLLIKEPGTTQEIYFDITEKGVTANTFTRGDSLTLKILKSGVKLISDNDVLMGKLDSHLSIKIYEAVNSGANVTATFLSGKDKKMEILIKSSIPIFKSKKQETKPYVKNSVIEDDEDE